MLQQLEVKDKIELDKSVKITPFKKEIRKTTPHKHNSYFEIIYLSEGSGYHFIDSRRFEVKPPIMYFIRQEQVHYWELDTEPEGFVVIIKKAFITKSLDNELKSLLSRISGQNSLYLNDNLLIHSLLEILAKENQADERKNFHVLEGLLKALLAKVVDVAKPVVNKQELKADLYQSFVEMLNTAAVVKHSVQYYAEKLNTSPQNLNAACRKAVDQSATGVLAGFIVSEARRLLLYTNNTISEMAFKLEFIDASHFVKYFKRATGQTPQAFRLSSE
jgi:AraC family transcriptional regulator, transcriptional activator of pobA